jgi:hypothetical protein
MLSLKPLSKKNLFLGILLILFIFPLILPLFQTGLFVSDDAEWMVIRLTAFHQALAVGELPVRFLFRLNHGYGYPVLNFLYPGGFYLGEIFHLIGLNFVNTVKLVFGLSVFLAGLFSFLWLKTKFSLMPSFLGSLFYVYTPYFLWDLYKRGSMGEILALAFVPLAFWAMEKKNWLWGGLVYGILIVSHNIIAFIFSPVFLFYLLLTIRPWRKILHAVLTFFLLGLSLSAFFWLPAIGESRLTILGQTVVSKPLEHLVSNLALLGLVNLLVFFLAFVLWLKKKEKQPGFFLGLFLLAVFFSTPLSTFFWQIFPWSFLFQFPFRFLSLTLPAIAFLVAFVFEKVLPKRRAIGFGLTFAVLFFFSLPFFRPTEFAQKPEGFYLTNEDSTTVHNEYLPLWVKTPPTERAKEKVELIEGEGEIKEVQDRGRRLEFRVMVAEPIKVRVNTLYYPGWQVFVDGKKATFSFENENGVIEIPIEKGDHQIKVEFGETPFRLLADGLSLVGAIFLGLWLIKRKNK